MSGKLYIVPTPVGNMEDMTMRAVRVLREADLILAEDTRTSGVLMKHFDIHTPMQSHHKYNEHEAVRGIVERLEGGMPARPAYPIQGLCCQESAGVPAYVWSACRDLRRLCLPWLHPACLVTDLFSRAFCLPRKVVPRVCHRWLPMAGRW